MTAKLSFFQKYMYSSMILNGIWKSIDIYDADVVRYVNNQNIKTKLLMTEKLTIVSIQTLGGPYILPFRLINNIDKFELKLRNEDYNKYYSTDYKNNLTFIDHIYNLR